MAEEKKTSVMYKIIKGGVRLFYPKTEVIGLENLPDEPCILVGNHAQMNGPICAELYCPGDHYTWCAGQMMQWEEVAPYAFEDFWSGKPKWAHPWFRLLSYIITPFSVCVFNNANTIGVYRDARIIGTFKNTVKRLQEGNHVVIFPEHNVKYNHIVYEFQDKFIDVAKLYYKKTGKDICFVPMYIAPDLRQIHLGKPVRFNHAIPMDDQRGMICRYLMDTVTDIACHLPRHRVVPYPNIPKRDHPCNLPEEEWNETHG